MRDVTLSDRIAVARGDEPADLLLDAYVAAGIGSDHECAAAAGADPLVAIRLATLNPAERFGLADRGAVAPNRRADLVVFRDLAQPRPEMVYKDGELVALDGKPFWPRGKGDAAEKANAVRIDSRNLDFSVPLGGRLIRGAIASAVAEAGGGLATAEGEKLLARLSLPIAGLMSDQPLERVLSQNRALVSSVRELGSTLHEPFHVLGFLGLEVIPALKITDRGLVDVERFSLAPLFLEEASR